MTDLADDARVLELMKPIRCWGGGGGTTFLDSRDVGEVIGALVAEVRELRRDLGKYHVWLSAANGRNADLERRLAGVMVWLTRHQPAGSPPPGDEMRLAGWIVTALESRLACMNEARALAEALVLSHEGHIARLEDEKARLIRTCPPGTCRVQSPAPCNCFADPEVAERLARLEEEKVQAEQMLQEGKALVQEGSSLLETTQQRLAQAEAREAVIVKENEELRRRLDERAPRS